MKPLFIANWKQYVSVGRSAALARAIIADKNRGAATVILAPSFLAIADVVGAIKHARARNIFVAAQDCGFTDEGAYTGAVSPRELHKAGVSHVIIGHSERRANYAEDNQLLAKKVVTAREAGLKVIYCVGETKEERNEGRVAEVVRDQLRLVKKMVDIIAYEPRWAIGTGLSIAPHEAEQIHTIIAKEVGDRAQICYGGSVNEKNIRSFVTAANTDGVLVGSASTSSKSCAAMFKQLSVIARV